MIVEVPDRVVRDGAQEVKGMDFAVRPAWIGIPCLSLRCVYLGDVLSLSEYLLLLSLLSPEQISMDFSQGREGWGWGNGHQSVKSCWQLIHRAK